MRDFKVKMVLFPIEFAGNQGVHKLDALLVEIDQLQIVPKEFSHVKIAEF